jgi:hypothetical protein
MMLWRCTGTGSGLQWLVAQIVFHTEGRKGYQDRRVEQEETEATEIRDLQLLGS